jgi:hypothetical protein
MAATLADTMKEGTRMRYRLALAPLLLALTTSCDRGSTPSVEIPPPQRTVAGTVTGVTASVLVTLACPDVAPEKTTYTDGSGAYAFDGVPAAICTVTPTLIGHRFDPPTTQLPAELASRSGVDFAASVAIDTLEVFGSDMSATYQNVNVWHLGFVVEDATVRVNGQAIPYDPTLRSYYGLLSRPLAAGDELSLEVTHAGATVTGHDTVPENALLTWPLDGASIPSDEYVVLTWTSVTSPDEFHVWADYSCGPDCGTGTTLSVPGTARSATLSTRSLPKGEIQLTVTAYNDGELSGDYEAYPEYPGMNIRAESNKVTITR